MPLISIVIPTYRRGALLSDLFEALLPQLDQSDAEAIIVDNCPDASARTQVSGMIARSARARYFHEPNPGVVNARNCGVRESRGTCILFLDDDEIPGSRWLASFAGLASRGVIAAFGKIEPRFEGTPDDDLFAPLDKAFSRRLDVATGTDVTADYAMLGTGNAMFHKEECFGDADLPFDARFNRTGGEDIWLIRGLIKRQIPLVWCEEGLVEEVVPANRMQARYMEKRRFNHGQLRCRFLAWSDHRSDWLLLPVWMGVGLIQTMLWGGLYQIATWRRSLRRREYRIRMFGGLGKVIWWWKGDLKLYSPE